MAGKILAVYNICGISGFENHIYYLDAIRSLYLQNGFTDGDLHLVVSGCVSSDLTKARLKDAFGSYISYNWIADSVPLTVSFNHTVNKCVEQLGAFDSYLYVDSGINFHDPMGRMDALRYLYDAHKSGPYAITSAMPLNDDGRSWWGIDYPPEDAPYIFPVGKTTNLHCQLYSEEMRSTYGRLHPDIFANDSSESVTSFLCAAMSRKFQMIQKVKLFHNQSMDGASIGWRGQNQDGTVKLFKTEKTMDERFYEGYEFGFGYEECKPRWLHDPDKFDDEGYAKDQRLLEFLKRELFLKPEEFNYDEISHVFEP